jgi:hypothetical protein
MSMDGSTSLFGSAAAGTPGRSGADAKKAISDAKLAELALVDPKRAKRWEFNNLWRRASLVVFVTMVYVPSVTFVVLPVDNSSWANMILIV